MLSDNVKLFRQRDSLDQVHMIQPNQSLSIFAGKWLNTPCPSPDSCAGADLSGNGTVDLTDFAYFTNGWLDCTDPYPPCSHTP